MLYVTFRHDGNFFTRRYLVGDVALLIPGTVLRFSQTALIDGRYRIMEREIIFANTAEQIECVDIRLEWITPPDQLPVPVSWKAPYQG